MIKGRSSWDYPVILLPSILQAYLELSSSPLRTSVEKPNFSLIQPQKYNESINKSVWASYGILSLVILLFLANFSLNLSDLLILVIGLIFLIFAGSQVSVLLKYLYQAKYQEQYQEYQDNFVSYQTKCRKLDSYNKVTERAWLRKELKVKKFRQQILKEILIEKVATISLESFYPRDISRNDALLVQVGEKFLRLIQDIFGEKISQFNDFIYFLIAPDTHLHFIIFIDIPYSIDKNPLHWIGNERDEAENQTFLNGNWIVVRFAEQQVALSPEACCQAIAEIYTRLTQDEQLSKISTNSNLMTVKRWTKEEAEKMAIWEVRQNYLREIFLNQNR